MADRAAAPPRLEDRPPPRGLSPLGAQLRRYDHDRYLTCLFAPADRREALFAVYAFNLEVAKTREAVSEPMVGQIRLQWWRDRIGEAYAGRPARHEVLEPLADAMVRYALDRRQFDRLIDAREADLADEALPDADALRRYTADTGAAPLRLALQVLDGGDEPGLEAAERIGEAWALIGLLRAVPFQARRRSLLIPEPLLARFGVDRGDVYELRPHEGLRRLARALGEEAEAHVAAARALRQRVRRRARPALLLARLADSHLATLRKADWNVFDGRVTLGAPGRQLPLAWAKLLGRY